jgi:hypothetical protein
VIRSIRARHTSIWHTLEISVDERVDSIRLRKVHAKLVEERRTVCNRRPNQMRLVEIVQANKEAI